MTLVCLADQFCTELGPAQPQLVSPFYSCDANIVPILTGMSNSLGVEGRVIYGWEIFTQIIETNKLYF